MRLSALRRLSVILIAVGALASLLVAADRWRFESRNRSVEIAMDQLDLVDFAHAYGYDLDELLRALRRAGLTSVAVYEELGQRVNLGNHAYVQGGQQLVDDARTSALADPALAAMARANAIDPNSVYILVYDAQTLSRYLRVLRTQLEPKNVRLIRSRLPAIVAVKTQIDFFNGLGLGIPEDFALRVRRLGLLVDPRVQNNERLSGERIPDVFNQMLAGGKIGTIIFFGQRNEVLGYPYNLDATADAFRSHRVNFGLVEAYDRSQIQKGSETLARNVVGQTVRVQAISKIELDRLDLDTVIARYALGVRERNIRLIYLRPFPQLVQKQQPDGTLVTESAEQTNLDMVRELRDRLAAAGFHTGRSEGFVNFKGPTLQALYFVAAIGIAAAFLLFLDLFGWARWWMAWTFFGITTVAFWAATGLGHDDLVRKAWALGGALTFGVLAATTVSRYFTEDTEPSGRFAGDALAGVRSLATAAGVALLGGLFITGVLSQATFMIEAQQFSGVKLLLVAPPLAVVVLFALTPKFGWRIAPAHAAEFPLRAWHVAILVVLAAAAALLVVRSGNQPDVGVSAIETHVRGALTALVGARPRLKEFLIGFPLLMLLPALRPDHRRLVGWLVVLGSAVGLADVLDTFSHVHTPLAVGLLRLFNALVAGAVIGLLFQAAYRAYARRAQRT